MPFPLHKSPLGLLELMRLRTLGRNPTQFGEDVVPVIDAREFYAADILTSVNAPNSVGALLPELESALTFTQPRGIRALSLVFVQGAAAGTNYSFNVDLQLFVPALSAFLGVTVGQWNMPALAAGQVVRVGVPFSCVVPAGGRFAAHVSGTAAGADHVIHARALVENYAPNA